MYAVEFETTVNDNTILLPGEYAEFESQEVKVIVMMEPKAHNKSLGKRKPGTAKGKIFITDDFDRPLTEEITDLFYQ